jgi:Lon-like ATP-dependent protease
MDCNTLWDIAHRCGFSAAYEGCTLANEGLGNDGLPHKPYIQTGEATRLLNSILEERFPEILADLGGHPVCVELARSKWDQASLCISITNSYQSGNKKPKEEHIAKLVEFFGIGRKEDGKSEPYGGPEPAWWLDGLWCVWRWYDARLYKIEMGLLKERY